jgi:hypothetical protein
VQPPDRLACGGIPELDHAAVPDRGAPFSQKDITSIEHRKKPLKRTESLAENRRMGQT